MHTNPAVIVDFIEGCVDGMQHQFILLSYFTQCFSTIATFMLLSSHRHPLSHWFALSWWWSTPSHHHFPVRALLGGRALCNLLRAFDSCCPGRFTGVFLSCAKRILKDCCLLIYAWVIWHSHPINVQACTLGDQRQLDGNHSFVFWFYLCYFWEISFLNQSKPFCHQKIFRFIFTRSTFDRFIDHKCIHIHLHFIWS